MMYIFDSIRPWTPTPADPASLAEPTRWRKPALVEVVPDVFDPCFDTWDLDQILGIIVEQGRHTFLVATEHPEWMCHYFKMRTLADVYTEILAFDDREGYGSSSPLDKLKGVLRCVDAGIFKRVTVPEAWPLPNLILGLRAADQAALDAGLPHLLQCPARRRWLDLRGLREAIRLCRVDASEWHDYLTGERCRMGVVCRPVGISWVRVRGGEEPLHPDWVRWARDQCAAASVPFNFGGWGVFAPLGDTSGLDLDHHYPGRGRRVSLPSGVPMDEPTSVFRVGSRCSGRMLDGREHNDLPRIEP